ncbi:uncharacterized protein EI97DRAFT_410967 [Westerdykella ornata]|uniref:Brl1/Brr6 domain-containing protein n=1 Tax=Westerdykella ornata TaxID=318751 RepID=A0A6A6JUZ9_WESOR|nr:uncharacterized protein EI97DRAFT_410967 [Westerdykella ornata]KAF2280044.1 hypothetical protein EI97DRAFT_410967 [Westerdykella ornata]
MFRPTGPHSVLDSSSKSAFHTPNRPQLREPHSEHFLFSQQKPLTAVPAHLQNSPWEPRTPSNTFDFSSGGETPNTPAQESECATPDTQIAERMGRLMSGEELSTSPKKNRRDSWMALKSVFSSSSSPAKETRKPYSTKAEHRVMKRRSKNRKSNLRDGYESDNTQLGIHTGNHQNTERPGYARQAGDLLSWVEAHPQLPSVLSTWFQLIVNALLGLTVLYIIYIFYSGVQADIGIEAKKHEAEAMREISVCHKSYRENRCDPDTRVPAMESACGAWEVCMSRDPKAIARASVSAKTFAQIFNAFVQEFSYKSMVGLVFFFPLLYLSIILPLERNRRLNCQHRHDDSSRHPPASPGSGFWFQKAVDGQKWRIEQHEQQKERKGHKCDLPLLRQE